MKVALLTHRDTMPDTEMDDKIIGMFRTESEAIGARNLLVTKPGFADFPDGFRLYVLEVGAALAEPIDIRGG